MLGRTGCEAHPSRSVASLSAPAARSTLQAFSWPLLAAPCSGVHLVDGGVHDSKLRRTTPGSFQKMQYDQITVHLWMRIMSESEDAFFIGPVRENLTNNFGCVSGSQVPRKVCPLDLSRGYPRDSRTFRKSRFGPSNSNCWGIRIAGEDGVRGSPVLLFGFHVGFRCQEHLADLLVAVEGRTEQGRVSGGWWGSSFEIAPQHSRSSQK